MASLNPLQLIGIVDGLLIPIHKAISFALPAFIKRDLKDSAVREQIVVAADQILIKKYPEANLISKETRRKIIRKILAITIDDVLLPDTNNNK